MTHLFHEKTRNVLCGCHIHRPAFRPGGYPLPQFQRSENPGRFSLSDARNLHQFLCGDLAEPENPLAPSDHLLRQGDGRFLPRSAVYEQCNQLRIRQLLHAVKQTFFHRPFFCRQSFYLHVSFPSLRSVFLWNCRLYPQNAT